MSVRSSKHKLAIAHGDEILVGTQPVSLAEGIVSGVNLYSAGGFAFIGADGECTSMGYSECFERAQRILNGLRRRGVTPGDKLILYFRECRDFIPTLWAALLCGAIPVPLTRSERSRYHAAHTPQIFRHLRRVLNAPRVITDGLDKQQLDALGLGAGDLILPEAVETEAPTRDFFEGSLDEPQILILTSGTTASPNVVTLSARALIHRWWPNLQAPQHSETFLSWSPFDHVMGLSIASPNLPTKVYIPTAVFVQSPELWLATLERFQVTHCFMTNFGMALMERAAAAGLAVGKRWNLSSVRKIGVGAEPIAPDVCDRFITTLQACGLRQDAVILGYGLSECGPVVGGEHHFSPIDSRIDDSFVVLDRPTRGHSVRIVGVDGKLVAEREIGEVQVKGPTMTLGYYGDDAATHGLFTDDGWLRTRDLGFLREGRLTITGREKETIVINAKKFACMEIETIAQTVTGVDAAFAVACNTRNEGLGSRAAFALFFVAPSLTPSDIDGLLRRLRTKVAARFGLAPDYLVRIAEEDIPFTPTGKVRRLQLAARLEAGVFDGAITSLKSLTRAPRANATSETERLIASIWGEILGVEDCDLYDDFFDLGGDSLAAIRLTFELERTFGRDVPSKLLHERTTIARLAAFFDRRPLEPVSAFSESALAEPPEPLTSGEGLDPEIENKLRALTIDWRGEKVTPQSLLFGVNCNGKKRPLFWCFQLSRELWQLAASLGPEQPVYGMRSASLAMDYTPVNTAALAHRYIEEILSIDPVGPYLIGGNCQGGIIAVAIARQLQKMQRQVLLLSLLDASFWDLFAPDPYTGKVIFFAGVRSLFNPYRRFSNPAEGWRKLFPGGLRIELLPADYDFFFETPVMAEMAPKFRSALAWAMAEDGNANGHASFGPLPISAYRAELKAPSRIVMAVGEVATIPVAVTNTGTATWGPSHESGIFLGNHWLTSRGEIVVWSDGRTRLDRSVGPGERAMLNLSIRAPTQAKDYLIEVDLVEEGVTWFKDKQAHTLILEAVVSQRRFPITAMSRLRARIRRGFWSLRLRVQKELMKEFLRRHTPKLIWSALKSVKKRWSGKNLTLDADG